MADRCLSLLLVSPDALVRLGLQSVLGEPDRFQIRSTTATLGATLAEWQTIGAALLEAGSLEPEDPVIVILQNQDWGSLLADLLLLGQNPTTPPLRPLLLGTPPNRTAIRQAQALGAQGYCLPTVGPDVLVQLVQAMATPIGWVEDPGTAAFPPPPDRPPQPAQPSASRLFHPLQTWLHPLLRSGLTQVQATLAQSAPPDLDPTARPWSSPWLNQRLVAGQWRELQAAQWLLQQSLRATGSTIPAAPAATDPATRPDLAPDDRASPAAPLDPTPTSPFPSPWPPAQSSASQNNDTQGQEAPNDDPDRTETDSNASTRAASSSPPLSNPSGNPLSPDRAAALAPFPSPTSLNPTEALPDPSQVQTFVLGQLRECLQHYPLQNTTAIPLEIDILRSEKQRELLLLTLQCWDEQLTLLRQNHSLLDRDLPLMSQWIQDLWQDTLTRFLQPYGDLPLETESELLVPWGTPPATELNPNFNRLNLVSELIQALPSVDQAILQQIPQVDLLFSALLWGTPVSLDGVPYRIPTPEALDRLVLLGQNLLITIANGVMQPLLDRFGHRELIKQTLYRQQLLSTREVERFRNNLSWKYRVILYWETPRNIYESRHWLWGLDRQGLRRYSIYAPRRRELIHLSRPQKVYTLLLEFRDAIAPRLQALTAWIGSGVVYVLTQVIGRAIGLVGRGILQGIGSSWGDRRF